MPGGVPVATVAAGVGGPINAALLAARILALGDAGLARRLERLREEQVEKVLAKDAELQKRLRP
jgi:5-(carboxyamino)imidazole ribonucleotide mutase